MKIVFRYGFACLLLVASIAFARTDACAQTINTLQALNFGQVVVKDNDSQYEIELSSDGGYTHNSRIVFLQFPEEGQYRLTGADPLRNISVSVTVDQQLIGGASQFTIDNFDIDAPTQTDALGEADIFVGARLRTTGNGVQYPGSSTFNGVLTLTINYI